MYRGYKASPKQIEEKIKKKQNKTPINSTAKQKSLQFYLSLYTHEIHKHLSNDFNLHLFLDT